MREDGLDGKHASCNASSFFFSTFLLPFLPLVTLTHRSHHRHRRRRQRQSIHICHTCPACQSLITHTACQPLITHRLSVGTFTLLAIISNRINKSPYETRFSCIISYSSSSSSTSTFPHQYTLYSHHLTLNSL